jgi:hypothetical protein
MASACSFASTRRQSLDPISHPDEKPSKPNRFCSSRFSAMSAEQSGQNVKFCDLMKEVGEISSN